MPSASIVPFISGATRALNAEIKLNLNFVIGFPSLGLRRGAYIVLNWCRYLAVSKTSSPLIFLRRPLRIKRVCREQSLDLHLARGKSLVVRVAGDRFQHRRVGFDHIGKRIVAQPIACHREMLLTENQR